MTAASSCGPSASACNPLPPTALAPLLADLAAGHVPAADAGVTVLPAPLGARAAVVGGTAWHVVAADVDPGWVAERTAADPVGAPLGARFLAALADEVGAEPGCLDAVLVAPTAPVERPAARRGASPGRPSLDLSPLDLSPLDPADLRLPGHPRVARSRRHRADVRVWSTHDDAGLLTLGRGLAGRWEVAVEVEPPARGRGLGAALVRAAPALVPAGEQLWAQVAPANTASLRAFLAAGYRPVAAEVLFPRP